MKKSETIEWLELNLPSYIQHNQPSPVTKEAIKNINKAIARIDKQIETNHKERQMDMKEHNKNHEAHMAQLVDELKEIRKEAKKTYAAKWSEQVMKGMIGTILAYFLGGMLGLFQIPMVAKLINLIA